MKVLSNFLYCWVKQYKKLDKINYLFYFLLPNAAFYSKNNKKRQYTEGGKILKLHLINHIRKKPQLISRINGMFLAIIIL